MNLQIYLFLFVYFLLCWDLGDAVVQEKEAKPAVKRQKKQNSAAWAQLISQYSEVAVLHLPFVQSF